MINRKDLVISFLAVFCMIVVVLPRTESSNIQATQLSEQEARYDAWLDQNEDGLINILDIAPVAMAFGTEGDPTRTVTVMNSHIEWYSEGIIYPDEVYWGFSNETAGYRQVSIAMCSNATVDGWIQFYIPAPINETSKRTYMDEFEVTGRGGLGCGDYVYKTYDVMGPRLMIVFSIDSSATKPAHVRVALYATT